MTRVRTASILYYTYFRIHNTGGRGAGVPEHVRLYKFVTDSEGPI